MKLIKKIILIGLILLLVVGIGIWWKMNEIVRSVVSSQATSSLNLQTDLESATLSIFGGEVTLSKLKVANPKGFSNSPLLTVNKTHVGVHYSELRDDPIRVAEVEIDGPILVVEQADGKMNFQAAMDDLPKSEPATGDKRAPSQPLHLIIGKIKVTNAKVILRPGLPGLNTELPLPLPDFELKDVGTGDGKNGIEIKDLAMKLMAAMMDSASQFKDVPGQLKGVMEGAAKEISSKIDNITKQLGKGMQDAGKSIEKGFKDLFKKDK